MRIEAAGHGAQIPFQKLVLVELLGDAEGVAVAFLNAGPGFILLDPVDNQAAQLILDPAMPPRLGLLRGPAIGHGLAVENDRVVLGEIELLDGKRLRPTVGVRNPFHEAFVDKYRKRHVAVGEQLRMFGFKGGEFRNVGFEEEELARVELVEEQAVHPRGDLVVQLMPRQMGFLDDARDALHDLFIAGVRVGESDGRRRLERRLAQDKERRQEKCRAKRHENSMQLHANLPLKASVRKADNPM